MTKRLKKLLVAITIGVVLITAGIISGVCVINASLAKRPTYVSTAEELETAINDDVDKPIVLNNDIVVHGDLNANKLFDLEMNGHDLRVIGKMTLRTSKAGEMYLCDGKTAIKSREKVQADSVEIDAVNATVTWNANVQLKDGYTADDFVVAAADHSFIFNGIMLGAGGHATKTAMTVKQGRVVVAVKDEDVKAPAEIVVPAGANGVLVDNKTDDEVNIKASTSVSVSGNVSIDVDENAEDVKISAKTDSSKVTIKSGTVSSVDASGSEVIVDKGAVVDGKITAGKVENNGTVGEIEAGEIVDNSVAIYKEDKKNELDEYALAKGKDSYTSDNWTAVQLAVTAGKTAIDKAADIAAVDVAFAAAKAEIDKVKTAEQEAADALANKKTETLAALEAYAESKGEANYTAENWTAIQSAVTAGKTAIDKAADIAAVDAAFAEAKTAIDAIETVADSLEAYKTTQKAALEAYGAGKGQDNYTAENWTAIQSAVTAGKTAIAAAANETAVDAAYNTAAANIDAVKTIAQQLADKKAEVAQSLKAAYDGIDLMLYRETEKNAITAKYEELKAAVNAVTDIANLPGTFVTDFNAFVAKQKTNAQLTAEELAAKKAEVIATLDEAKARYAEADYRAAQWKNITDAYDNAKNGINAVTVITALPGNFVATFTETASAQKTNAQLTAEELAAKKAEVLQNLKAAYDGIDLTLYRETEKNAITAKYEELKAAVNAVTDIANLPGTFVTDFNAFVAAQKTNAQLTAEELAAKKAEVIATLDEAKARYAEADYRAAQWKNITDAYDNAKNGINAVTDIAQLPGNFVSNFTTVAAAQPTAADLDEQELAAKKTEANQALENHYNSKKKSDYSDTDWDNITKFYNSGSETINSAETIAQVEKSLASAIAKMDEIKRSYLLAPEYNGGSGAQGESMRIYDDGKTYSLSEPEKENYVFMGWYTSSDFTEDTKVTHVTYESGIKKIYAKWGVMVDVQLPGVDTGYAVEPGKVFGDVFTDVGNFADMMGMGVPYGYYYVDTTGDIHKVESTDVNNFTEPVTVYAVFKVDNALYMYSGDMGDNHTLMVIGAVEVDGALTIKESIEYCDVAMPVTKIAKGAFVGATVTELRIPASVKEIGSTIFAANSTVVVYTNASEQEIAAWGEEWKTGSTVYTFDEYKADKKAALEAYGADKGQDNYTAENWTAIQDAVTAGQNAIDNAADKTAVDAAFEAAKTEIDSVALAKARLDGTNYDSFAGALAALTTGEEHTLTLLADIEDTVATEYVFDGVNVTLDLNGHVLDGLAYGGSGVIRDTHYIIVRNEAVLTINDSSEAKTGKITSWYAGNSALNVIYVENAKVVLNGGTITAHDANYGMVGIMAKANANVEINGGEVQGLYFKANRKRGYAIDVAAATATLTVNGGVLSTNDPSCYAIYNTASDSTVSVNGGTIAAMTFMKNTVVSITGGTFKSAVKPDYLTKGYACLKNEDGTYRVESGYVVTVGSVKYDTLSAAITAANTGDVITVYNDVTENEGNIKYIIRKALTISGAYGATGVKPVIKGTFAVDINGVSDGTDVVTIENLEIVHNGVYVKDGWTQDTKGAVVLQDGGITLKNNYIHLVNPAPANVSNSPSGLQLSRRGASVSTGAITVSGNTFGAYPKYSDKTNTIATAIQVTRNYTLSGVLVYGGLEVDDEKIYTGNKYENTDGNAQYVLYGNFDFAADKRGYTYVVFGDVFAYNRDGGDLLAGGKMIIARSFTLTDKVYEIKAGTELVIESGATLNGNGLTLNVYGTLTVKGKIENTNIVYGDDASRTIYLNGSEVDDSTVFDENAEYVVDINRSTDAGAFTIAAAAKVKKMTINLKLYSGNLNITDAITVVSPIVVNGYGAVKNTAKKTPFNVTADTAFIVKSGSLELNKIELKHTGTSEGEKNFIVADANANVTVDLATVAFVATADNTCFFNVAFGATFNLNFVDDGSTFKVNTSTMVATADVFTVTKVEDGADYVGADYYGNNFAAHNRDAYSTVNVTDKNGNSLFNIENAIVTKGDETPTYYVATGAGLKTAITSGADYVKLMDNVVGSGESDTDVTVTAKTGDLETVIDLNGKQFGYELNLSTIILNDAKKYEDTGYTLKVTIKNGKIGTESGYNQDAVNGRLYYGVLCQGNGVFLTLENVESSAYYGGLYANGAWKDNVITATDCKFASTIAGCGAYLPGKNTYNFTNCTFTGSVGVYIKSGDTTFTDCTIEGKGEYLKPTYNGNGADGEGSGLVVDSTKGYQTPMTVTVNGGSITSVNGYAIEEVSNAKDNADKICYSTVTVSKETVLTGKLGRVYSENGTVMVEDESGVKTAYASTAAGVAKAMANGGTVVLTNDVVATTKADSELPIKAQYGNIETVIDLNGKALGYELQLMNTIDGKSTDYTLKVTIKNGKLGSQTENGKFSDGSRHEYGILMQGDKVDLTLENVEVTAFYAGLYGNGQYDGSEITATKCTFNGKNACSMYMPANYTSVFTDCTFSGTVYLKSGNTTFNNCVIDDTIVGEHRAPTYNASGSTGWGSGVIVDSCYGYQQPMIVKFNGGSIKSALGYAIEEASTAPAGKDKVSYATVTVSKKTVLEGALGEILSENKTVIKEQA